VFESGSGGGVYGHVQAIFAPAVGVVYGFDVLRRESGI
jgi:hypothetical protein